MEINRNVWFNYIKTYEAFNKKIPDELKSLFNDIRNRIGNPTSSFNLEINLNDFDFCDLILDIEVIFNELNNGLRYEDKDIIYYSFININDLVLGKNITKIPVKIADISLNTDKLSSVLSHEIRHIYDIYTINEESDMKSFINSLYYSELSKKEDNQLFLNFLQLIYLSLEHELIARNTMIWEMFINCKCSKQEMINLYHESFMYKSLINLSDFNYTEILKVKGIENKVNNFINYFGGNICTNENDIKTFFNNWTKYFNEKSKEYIKEGYLVIDDLMKLNEFTYNKPKIKNIKQILLEIHNKYIL